MRAWWRCKDGRTVWIDEMSDDHLRNTIRMLERRAEHITASINGPNMAWDSDDLALMDDWGGIWLSQHKEYEAMCYEAKRRNLVIGEQR